MSTRPSPASRGASSPGASTKPGPAGAPAAQSTLLEAEIPASLEGDGGRQAPSPAGDDPLAAAALAAAEGDQPQPTIVRVEGLDGAELAEISGPALPPLGFELACQRFEDGELRVGTVIAVRADENGAILRLDELGWEWPVRLDRINVGAGEWVHAATDYPTPGADKVWDRAHRMSEAQREEEDEVQRRATETAARETAAERAPAARQTVAPAARAIPDPRHAEQRHAAAPKKPEGILATWNGPGSLAGSWVTKDGVHRDGAKPGSTGYFATATVHHARFKGKFTLLVG